MANGLRRRHSVGCAARKGRRCDCRAGWEAFVFSARDGRKIRRTFPTMAAAKAWRADAVGGLVEGRCELLARRPFARPPRPSWRE